MIRFEIVTVIDAPIERCFDLSRSVEVHLAANAASEERAVDRGGVSSGLIGLGQDVTWRGKHFGVRQELTSRTTKLVEPTYLEVTMVRGAFRSMQAEHVFRDVGSGRTEMRDRYAIEAPLGWLGRVAEVMFLERYMRAALHERGRVIKLIAETREWRAYLQEGV